MDLYLIQQQTKQFVVHCKQDSYNVYIGRPQKWGNPFIIGKHGNRQDVIIAYYNWIKSSSLLTEIEELRGNILGCWCAPKLCHGHILAALANGLIT